MPVIPIMAGRMSMVMSMKTKEREKAKTAEISPLDKAVNSPLAKILKPIKSSAKLQRRLPVTAKSYTGLSGRAKIATNGLVKTIERIAVIREMTVMIFRLVVTNF